MKTIIASAIIGTCLLASACGGGDGTVESCATSFVGTAEGDFQGPMAAFMMPTGEMHFVFDREGFETGLSGDLVVDAQGNITTETSAMVLEGKFDLDSCEGSGTWTSPPLSDPSTGTWELRPL